MRSRFIFQILYRNAEIYLTALRSIERKSEQIETQLHKSTRNEELIELMELEKTIVYFKASLKTNERVIKKLTSATSNIKKYLEDEDLLEDTLIETQQAIEMADIYGNVLHSMTETFCLYHFKQPEQYHENLGPRDHRYVCADHDFLSLRNEL